MERAKVIHILFNNIISISSLLTYSLPFPPSRGGRKIFLGLFTRISPTGKNVHIDTKTLPLGSPVVPVIILPYDSITKVPV